MKFILPLFLATIMAGQAFAYSQSKVPSLTNNPCEGANALLNLMNRPTIADSACTVPPHHLIIESGYQYQRLITAGDSQNAPNVELRFGLLAKNEFLIYLPNAIHQSRKPTSGFTATTLGFKHQFLMNETWGVAVETLITPPNGSYAFGSGGNEVLVNGIFTYTINEKLNLAGMLGGESETTSRLYGSQRFQSVNPDIALFYFPNKQTNLFAEIYGQSQTGPGQGSGFNANVGIIYLINPKLTVDLEFAQNISGNLGGFVRYVGAGLTILLGA